VIDNIRIEIQTIGKPSVKGSSVIEYTIPGNDHKAEKIPVIVLVIKSLMPCRISDTQEKGYNKNVLNPSNIAAKGSVNPAIISSSIITPACSGIDKSYHQSTPN
jgi:hypothetical protein